MSKFTDAIEHNWPDYTITPGASRLSCCVDNPDDISDEDLQTYDEGNFVTGVYCPCQSCGSTYGGNRYPAHAISRSGDNNDIHHIEICVDCLMFHANSDEPDDWQQNPS